MLPNSIPSLVRTKIAPILFTGLSLAAAVAAAEEPKPNDSPSAPQAAPAADQPKPTDAQKDDAQKNDTQKDDARKNDAKKNQPAPAKRDKPLTIAGKADPSAKGYIILFDKDVDAKAEVARLEKLYGFKHKYVYSMPGFKGFAGDISKAAVEKLRWELKIKSIEHDGVVTTQGGGMGAN